jgi:TetR/AcrR family transcriptional regulator, transcriptional repressor for nem operon
MAAAGLTHGGFYRHFRNKEQLVAEALSAAGDKTIAVVGRNIGKGGVNAAVDSYLSTSHRDSPSPICPFAALGSEMARAGEETKAAATEVLERLFATLAGGASGTEARGQAIVGLSTMIGAMTLARIAADSPLSEEILNRRKITYTDNALFSLVVSTRRAAFLVPETGNSAHRERRPAFICRCVRQAVIRVLRRAAQTRSRRRVRSK